MNTKAHKRSSQEIQAIRSVSPLDYLRPLVPVGDEVKETDPHFIAWFNAGRKVGE